MLDRFAGFYFDEISSEHRSLIDQIIIQLRDKDWVKGIYLEGSYAEESGERDIFSDIDICIVVKKNQEKKIAKQIKKLINSFCNPHFYHRAPCGSLTYCIWILPFIRLDLSFRELKQINRKYRIGKHIKILLDKRGAIKKHFKKRKRLTSQVKVSMVREMDSSFWMNIFFIYTKIEKNDFCAVYDSFHFIVKSIILKLRRLDYNAPPNIQMYNIKKKDPYLYKELEIILDFPNEPTDSMLRAVILYKNLLKRIVRQEGLKFQSEAEAIVLRTIQRGLMSKPKRWL